MRPVAVVGATGYTGRLITAELAARGLEAVVVGRSRDKLAALPGDVGRRVADASDVGEIRSAVEGCAALVSCVGPFVDLGEPTLRAAIEASCHYIDTTGEQAFMRTVFERYDVPAREAGVAVVPAIGFDYVPGDMAAALAVRSLGRAPERVDVYYLVRRAKSSDGTKRTGMRVAELPCLVQAEGRLEERSIGALERRFDFASGEANVALWPGGEVLTVPRHTGARNVSVYMRMPKVAARIARGAGMASPLMRAGRAMVGAATRGPNAQERARAAFEVAAVASADGASATCRVEGRDMYGLTAVACVEALVRLASQGFDRTGALAPSEAFDPADFLGALSRYLSYRVEGQPPGGR